MANRRKREIVHGEDTSTWTSKVWCRNCFHASSDKSHRKPIKIWGSLNHKCWFFVGINTIECWSDPAHHILKQCSRFSGVYWRDSTPSRAFVWQICQCYRWCLVIETVTPVWCCKTAGCNWKGRCVPRYGLHRFFVSPAPVSVAGKSFPQLHYRGSCLDGACCIPVYGCLRTQVCPGWCIRCRSEYTMTVELGFWRHTAMTKAFYTRSFLFDSGLHQPCPVPFVLFRWRTFFIGGCHKV